MNKFFTYPIVIMCLFILGVSFNLFFASFDMIISGTSGLAIILANLLNTEIYIILFILHFIALIFGYLYLSKEILKKSLLGLILFPVFVYLTTFVQDFVILLDESDFLVFLIFGALISGITTGIIFKYGYTYGGGGLIVRIINKYYGQTIGVSAFYFNGIIILLGGFVLGFDKILYAILIIYLSTYLQDRILLGDYANKLVIINTAKTDQITNFLQTIGIKGTIIESEGGYSKHASEMIMCYLNNHDYFHLKKGIGEIDKNAFIFVTNAYSRENGIL